MQNGGGYETFAREFLQRLGGVALTLNREVEDVAGEVWQYLEGLSADLTEEQRIEAAKAAVLRLEGEATKAAAPTTRSQRSIIERDVEFLSKRTDTLEKALRKGAVTPIQCAARAAEAALEAVENFIRLVAVKEKWTTERRDQLMSETWGPVQELLKRAMEGRRAAAIAEWTREVRKIVLYAREWAEEILDEKSTDYTLKEVCSCEETCRAISYGEISRATKMHRVLARPLRYS
jgi:hypothetical protein